MNDKFLRIGSLALLKIVIVGNLQVLPTNAAYGSLLPFLYLVAIIGFFIPCILMVAELATTRPQTGGAYIWCEEAFGPKMGFFTVCILWISNLLWYPSIFSLIAANFAYLFDVTMAQNKYFVLTFALTLFWMFTGLNCIGVKFSSQTSILCSITGVIFPMILIIVAGMAWIHYGNPSAIHLSAQNIIPSVSQFNNAGMLIAIAISLFGIELTAVHAGNVVSPKRDFPASLFIAGSILVMLLLLSELAIAIILPADQLNIVTGLLDALILFFQTMHWHLFILPILLLVFIGNIGSVAAWMLASTRGMYIACKNNNVSSFLQKVNSNESPVGVLLFEAIIFTIISGVFLLFPNVSDSFWLLLDIAAQVTLIYYIILFAAAIKLRYRPHREGFKIPGGNLAMWLIMGLGIFTSATAFLVGFFSPDNLDANSRLVFHAVMFFGLAVSFILPFALLKFKTKK